jgi:hypothetical protein
MAPDVTTRGQKSSLFLTTVAVPLVAGSPRAPDLPQVRQRSPNAIHRIFVALGRSRIAG